MIAWHESERPFRCAMCRKPMPFRSRTTQDAGSPEMLRIPPNGWLGVVSGDVGPEIVVTCSDRCTERLLSK